MPTIANVTVKKNDGTTDITYSAIEGKSGDQPARYRAPALGATPQTAPDVRIFSKPIPGTSKTKVVITFNYPYSVVNSTTGVTTIQSQERGRLEYTGDDAIPASVSDEAVSQWMNFLASAHVKDQLKQRSAAI